MKSESNPRKSKRTKSGSEKASVNPTAGKSSNPSKESDLSKAIYRELANEIKQALSLDPPLPKSELKPSPTDIATVAAALSAARNGQPGDKELNAAIDLWNGARKQLEARETERRIEDAVRKLIFKNGEDSVTLEKFLQRLLPNDMLENRKTFMHEALRRIPSTFSERFQENGKGWPTANFAELLSEPLYETADTFIDILLSGTENGITLKKACTIAPIILAWRDYVSNPRTRGSLAKIRRTPEPAKAPTKVDTPE